MNPQRSQHPQSPSQPARGALRWLAVVGLTSSTMLAACSSSDGASGDIASVNGADVPDGETVDDPNELTRQYRECMAAEGIDIPEVPTQGGNDVGSTTEVPAVDADPDEIAAADAICLDQLPDAPNPMDGLTPDQQAEFEDYILEVQRCVDDKGYEGISVLGEDVPGATEPPDFDWDAFDEATSDCYESIPLPEELAGIEAEG